MIGNVGSLVESMNAANNAKLHQNTANTTSENFKNYLNAALLNSQSGLFSSGLSSGYSYFNPMSGSIWQTVVLEALRDELKKENESEEKKGADSEKESFGTQAQKTKKEDWARIRVIRRYQPPVLEESKKDGILL